MNINLDVKGASRGRWGARFRWLLASLIGTLLTVTTLSGPSGQALADEGPTNSPSAAGDSIDEAGSARVVPDSHCRRDTPNIKFGVCHQTGDGKYTWLGSLVNPKGRIFFCIDKNLSSRLPANAPITSTAGLHNQHGKRVGKAEISALNYVIGKWGKTRSDARSAGVSLIIREVMSDSGGQLPSGLKVGQQVKRPSGQFPDRLLRPARAMWKEASAYRGKWKLRIAGSTKEMTVGETRTLKVSVISASGKRVPNALVKLTYAGPVSGPKTVTSKTRPSPLPIKATGKGSFTLTAKVRGPSHNGRLFDPQGAGIQRGWIAGQSTAVAGTSATMVIVPLVKVTVSTVVSDQTSQAGDTIHDTVTVAGIKDHKLTRPVRVDWTLYGPVVPEENSCAGLSWTDAPIAATGSLTGVTEDGEYTTAGTRLAETGCYSYGEEIPRTDEVAEYTHPVGQVSQTTLTSPLTPTVKTITSHQLVKTGGELRDTVTVSGLKNGIQAKIEWTLYGPLKPKSGEGRQGCLNRNWTNAKVFDRGSFTTTANGRHVTDYSRLITKVGCYTYGEKIRTTPQVQGYIHKPGLTKQTSIASTPRNYVVDSGYAGDARTRRGGAGRLDLPGIGKNNVTVTSTGNTATKISVPGRIGNVGWWNGSTRFAADRGSSVIVGHVSDRRDRAGALYRLSKSKVGDTIRWSVDGKTKTFKVTHVSFTKRTKDLPTRVWNTGGPQTLNIVSCARKRTNPDGSWHYTDNITVTAKLIP